MSTRTTKSGKKRRSAAGRAALALVLALGLGLPAAAFGTGEEAVTSFGEELSDVPAPAENVEAQAAATDEGAQVAGNADGELAPGDASEESIAAPAGAQAAPLDAAVTVQVDAQLYLKEQNGQTTYSAEAGGANPQAYTGPIALKFTGGSAYVTVEGAADIVIAEDAALTGDGGPVFDFKSGTSALIIAEGANVSLTGASDYAAIRVAKGASLTLLGAGSLQVTGGQDGPAIGMGNYDYDSFGTVRLAMMGGLRLDGTGIAPAIGDVGDNDSEGTVEFCAGSPQLASGAEWKDSNGAAKSPVNASAVTVSGGNFILGAQTSPALRGTYATGPSSSFPVTNVRLKGLPAGTDLTQIALAIDESVLCDPGFFAIGDSGTSDGYNVVGFSPLTEGAAPCVYLPATDALKAGENMQATVGDDLYVGTLAANGEGLTIDFQYMPKDYVETGEMNPRIELDANLGTIQLRSDRGIQRQYRLGRQDWVNYQGTLTLSGTWDTSKVQTKETMLDVLSGDHTVALRNVKSDIYVPSPAIAVEKEASVELSLIGESRLWTMARSAIVSPTIFIAEKGTCTISGKGKLEVLNSSASLTSNLELSATIGSACSGSTGAGERYMKGGSLIVRGGTLEVTSRAYSTSAPAIGAGHGASFESVVITGGKVITHGRVGIGGAADIRGEIEGSMAKGTVQSVVISGGTVDMSDTKRTPDRYRFSNVKSLSITGGSVIGGDGEIVRAATQAAAAPLSTVAFDAPVNDAAVALADDGGAVALAEESGVGVDADGAADVDAGSSDADDFEGDFDVDVEGDDEGDADPAVPVNAFGEELVPVTFTGLPADTNLADIGFRIVNIDLNGAERGLGDPVAVNEYGVYDVVTTDDGSMTFYLTNGQAYRRLVLAAWDGGTYAGMIAPGADDAMACAMRPTDGTLFYEGHTFEDGWLCEDADIFWAIDGSITGSEEGPALTAIRFATPIEGLTINYAADNGAGFGEMVASDDITGELMEPMISLKASLSGVAAAGRGIEYRAYVQGAGWTPWARDGEATQASGDAPVLAVEARLTDGTADGAAGDSSSSSSETVNPDRADDSAKDAVEAKKLSETGDAASAMLGWALAAAVAAAVALAACAARSRRVLSEENGAPHAPRRVRR